PFQKSLRLLEIAHKYRLISGPPITPLQRDPHVKVLFEVAEELEQRHYVAWPAANIEGLARCGFATFECCLVRAGQILHVKHVARLFSVTINRNFLSNNRRDCKPCDPSLILDAKLPRTVDAALSKRHTLDSINPRVVDRVLIGCALGTSVWRMEVDQTIFADALC